MSKGIKRILKFAAPIIIGIAAPWAATAVAGWIGGAGAAAALSGSTLGMTLASAASGQLIGSALGVKNGWVAGGLGGFAQTPLAKNIFGGGQAATAGGKGAAGLNTNTAAAPAGAGAGGIAHTGAALPSAALPGAVASSAVNTAAAAGGGVVSNIANTVGGAVSKVVGMAGQFGLTPDKMLQLAIMAGGMAAEQSASLSPEEQAALNAIKNDQQFQTDAARQQFADAYAMYRKQVQDVEQMDPTRLADEARKHEMLNTEIAKRNARSGVGYRNPNQAAAEVRRAEVEGNKNEDWAYNQRLLSGQSAQQQARAGLRAPSYSAPNSGAWWNATGQAQDRVDQRADQNASWWGYAADTLAPGWNLTPEQRAAEEERKKQRARQQPRSGLNTSNTGVFGSIG